MAEIRYSPLTIRPFVHLFIARRKVNWKFGALTIRGLTMEISGAEESEVVTMHSGGRNELLPSSCRYKPPEAVVQS